MIWFVVAAFVVFLMGLATLVYDVAKLAAREESRAIVALATREAHRTKREQTL